MVCLYKVSGTEEDRARSTGTKNAKLTPANLVVGIESVIFSQWVVETGLNNSVVGVGIYILTLMGEQHEVGHREGLDVRLVFMYVRR